MRKFLIKLLAKLTKFSEKELELLQDLTPVNRARYAARVLGLSSKDITSIKQFNISPLKFCLRTLKLTNSDYYFLKEPLKVDGEDKEEFRDNLFSKYLLKLQGNRPVLPHFGQFLKQAYQHLRKRDLNRKNPHYWRSIPPKSHLKAAYDALGRMLERDQVKVSELYNVIGFLYYCLYNLFAGGDFMEASGNLSKPQTHQKVETPEGWEKLGNDTYLRKVS